VQGRVVILVAFIGVIINTATALLFVRGQKHDLNIRGAFLHMAADAAVSLGVVVAGIAILYTGWLWLDPAISLAIDSVPTNVDPQAVADFLRQLPGVTGLHDLHIWAMSTTDVALTVHLTMDDCPDSDAFLHGLSHELAERFGIRHPTVQIERDAPEHCPLASPESL